MIQIIDLLKKAYDFFKLTIQIFLFLLLVFVLFFKGGKEDERLQNQKIELMKYAKKGNLLCTYRQGGRASGIGGKILECKDTSEVQIPTRKKKLYFVKSIPYPEIGQLYPVWYTDDLELVVARSFESKEENIEFLKKLNQRNSGEIHPYVIISVLLLLSILYDVVKNWLTKSKIRK